MARSALPHLDNAVCTAAGDEVAIKRKRQPSDYAGVSVQGCQHAAGGGLPHPERPVIAAAVEKPTVTRIALRPKRRQWPPRVASIWHRLVSHKRIVPSVAQLAAR